MGKCFTLFYTFDNLKEPSEKLINFDNFEIDAELQQVLNAIELNADYSLVKRTLALIKGM
jgi:hypothetical protein